MHPSDKNQLFKEPKVPDFSLTSPEHFVQFLKNYSDKRQTPIRHNITGMIWHKKHDSHQRLDHCNNLYDWMINIGEYMHCHPRHRYTSADIHATMHAVLSLHLKGHDVDWHKHQSSLKESLENLCVVLGKRIEHADKLDDAYTQQRSDVYRRKFQQHELAVKIEEKKSLIEKFHLDTCQPTPLDSDYPKETKDQLKHLAHIFVESKDIIGHLKQLYKTVSQMSTALRSPSGTLSTENMTKVASYLHNGIIEIHPLVDNNGKFARLCVMILLKNNGYHPNISINDDSLAYNNAISEDHSQSSMDTGKQNIHTAFFENYLTTHRLITPSATNDEQQSTQPGPKK